MSAPTCPVCGDTLQKNSPTSWRTVWSDVKQMWICPTCAEVEADQIERGIEVGNEES